MKPVYILLIILTILKIVTVASNGFLFGLLLFITGVAFLLIGRYANGVLTPKF